MSTDTRADIHDQSQDDQINWNNLVNGFNPSNQSIDQTHVTPIKQQLIISNEEKAKQNLNSSSKQKVHHHSRHSSTLSESDSSSERIPYRSKQKETSFPQAQLPLDEDLTNLNTHLQQVLEQDQSHHAVSDILLRHSSNQQTDRTSPNRKKYHHHRSSTSRHIPHEDNSQSITNVTLNRKISFLLKFN